jgi:predicted glutamine amidotransferase
MSAQTERENETNSVAREKSCECLTCNVAAQAIKTARKPICAAQNREENNEERLHRVHRRTQSAAALQWLASRQIQAEQAWRTVHAQSWTCISKKPFCI